MKLSKVTVKNLFDTFNHEVEINNNRGITIVIGENGLGKTVLLEMIESFFNSRFKYFSTVSFDKLIFEFNDDVKWTVYKELNIEQNEELFLVQSESNVNSEPIKLSNYDSQIIKEYAIQIGRYYNFRRISPNEWENRKTGVIYEAEELIDKYSDNFKNNLFIKSSLNKDMPEWFENRFFKINVTLIETQRIYDIKQPRIETIETVKKYSDQLSGMIKEKLTESTELSSRLDRTYPNRLIKELKQRNRSISDEELNDNLNHLEERRNLLDRVGLIGTEKDSNILQIDRPEDVVKDVLMLYIKDSFKKLSIFDEISVKIELLLKIINDRFKHKKLYVNKDTGFLFKSTVIKEGEKYQDIPIEKLSSGEKNELVLFYKLIFMTDKNSLILIDEPEISLHISWQNKFISDLNEIHELNKLDILIATHSPDIISDNWDLKVELKGVE